MTASDFAATPKLFAWVAGRPRAVTVVVAGYALVVAATAIGLWIMLVGSLDQPCTLPNCTWPYLSAQGFASLAALGITPVGWTVIAGGLTLVWMVVPFVLGVIVARADGVRPWLPALWFTFALGTLSSVPTGPVGVLLRVLTLGAWFTAFSLFPTGRFVPRWVVIAPVVAVVWTAFLALPVVDDRIAANDPLWWALEAAVYVSGVGVIVVGQIVQFRRSDADDRRALRLLTLPFGLLLVGGVGTAVVNAQLDADAIGYGTLGGALLYELSSFLTVILIACTAVATVRHGAYGARIVLDRVLVATLAVAGAGVVYTTVVAVVSRLLAGWVPSVIAATVTAVALAGTYGRLTRAVGRLVYGDADDPAGVAAALGARVAATTTPEALLSGIADTLQSRLHFPSVRVMVGGEAGSLRAVLPEGRSQATMSLDLDGQRLGDLVIALRRGQRKLTPRDRRALAAAAGPVAAALTALRLNEQLQRSRLDVLISRDDERRALRRRLHDDLGPTLALAGHRIAAARDNDAQLAAAARTIEDAVAQVRSIARDLRPPALDELGLRAAIADVADGLDLSVTLVAPEHVSPGVVEVAAYRITVEALLNAARHAGATRVAASVREEGSAWVVEVDDDGCGMPPDAVPGVGTRSMRERAAELGGTVTFSEAPLGGTRVRAILPSPRLTPTSPAEDAS